MSFSSPFAAAVRAGNSRLAERFVKMKEFAVLPQLRRLLVAATATSSLQFERNNFEFEARANKEFSHETALFPRYVRVPPHRI
jgi:hypothetical protein